MVGQATVVLRNRRPNDDPGPYPTANYLDYLRVYVPDRSELLGRTSERWLTLITYGGAFNPLTRDYMERVVVRARLVAE